MNINEIYTPEEIELGRPAAMAVEQILDGAEDISYEVRELLHHLAKLPGNWVISTPEQSAELQRLAGEVLGKLEPFLDLARILRDQADQLYAPLDEE